LFQQPGGSRSNQIAHGWKFSASPVTLQQQHFNSNTSTATLQQQHFNSNIPETTPHQQYNTRHLIEVDARTVISA